MRKMLGIDVSDSQGYISWAKVKAAGGIRDLKTAKAMIEAGADRLGTSATVNIVKETE